MIWPSSPLWRALGCLALAALVYRRAPPPDTMRCGLVLNLMCIAAITAVATWVYA